MRFTRIYIVAAAAFAALGVSNEVRAQEVGGFSVEARGIVVVPTFDINNAADPGPGFGAGFGYRINENLRLMADFDLGIHGTPTPNFNINTLHLMGKLGYDVVGNENVTVTVNAGAGVVQFGGDLPTTYNYFAINAGAKIAVHVSPMVDLLISPQGDIAFSDTAEVGTDNSWVWPFGVGLRVNFR